jgi:hypothetical protein
MAEDKQFLTSISSVAVGALGFLLIVLLAGIWLANDRDTAEPPRGAGDSRATRVSETEAIGPVAPSSPARASRMERCVSAAHVLGGPLEAARPALRQWQVHVDAMNQLVVGEITLQQATEFWNRTRVGAQRRVEDFDDSWAALRRQGVDCPTPSLMAPATPALRPCAEHVEAQVRVLQAARTSINTWREHVRHMDMLRLGMLSPEKATEMWLSMWRQGVRDLKTYHRAAHHAGMTTGCPASG